MHRANAATKQASLYSAVNIKSENSEFQTRRLARQNQRSNKLVSEMSGNVAMSNLVSIINQSISRYYDYYTSNRIKDETIVSHREIMDAIKSRDPILAEDVMRIHIVTNRRSLSQNKKNNLKKE